MLPNSARYKDARYECENGLGTYYDDQVQVQVTERGGLLHRGSNCIHS